MNKPPSPPEPPEMDSQNVGLIELDGVEDLTVRPMREPFRTLAIKKYGLASPSPSPPSENARPESSRS